MLTHTLIYYQVDFVEWARSVSCLAVFLPFLAYICMSQCCFFSILVWRKYTWLATGPKAFTRKDDRDSFDWSVPFALTNENSCISFECRMTSKALQIWTETCFCLSFVYNFVQSGWFTYFFGKDIPLLVGTWLIRHWNNNPVTCLLVFMRTKISKY